MGKSVAILIAVLIGCNVNCFAQGKVTRQKKETTETRQTVSKQKQEEEAKRQQEEAQRQLEEEAKRQQEEETKRQQEEEAKLKQEEEAKRKIEADEKRKQEEAQRKQLEEERFKETGRINGHGYVDLGLPSGLKWATCNVGASSPETYGNYFAWGETSTKSSYTIDNSLTNNKSISKLRSKGIINSNGNLNRNYDAASANWGSTWRMPTKNDFEELRKNCSWTWTTLNGKNGYKIMGPNGKSIFLPAAGYRYLTAFNNAGKDGNYWSSSVADDSNHAYRRYFNEGNQYTYWYLRFNGYTIRPVSE